MTTTHAPIHSINLSPNDGIFYQITWKQKWFSNNSHQFHYELVPRAIRDDWENRTTWQLYHIKITTIPGHSPTYEIIPKPKQSAQQSKRHRRNHHTI